MLLKQPPGPVHFLQKHGGGGREKGVSGQFVGSIGLTHVHPGTGLGLFGGCSATWWNSLLEDAGRVPSLLAFHKDARQNHSG